LEEKFTIPRRILKRKPSETIKDFDETIKKLKTDIENHDRLNMKLKEKKFLYGIVCNAAL
jgi:hypothetical protein